MKGTVEAVAPEAFAGYPGRRAEIQTEDGVVVVAQIFSDSETIWVVQAVGAAPRNADLDHVLESLVLT